eukprot:gene15329-2765_t
MLKKNKRAIVKAEMENRTQAWQEETAAAPPPGGAACNTMHVGQTITKGAACTTTPTMLLIPLFGIMGMNDLITLSIVTTSDQGLKNPPRLYPESQPLQ